MIPLYELNRRIVDLRASKVDKIKSNPDRGEYAFKGTKVYYSKKDRPPVIMKWCVRPKYDDKNPGVPLVESWKYHYGFDYVKASDWDYWVEGLRPDSEGHFSHGDAVLMKIPVEEYVKKVKNDRDESKRQLRGGIKSFRSRMRKQKAEIKDDVLGDILGVDTEPHR